MNRRIKSRALLAILLTLLLCAHAIAGPTFTRAISVTGGSAQQLSTVLVNAGYARTTPLYELTIKNQGAATLYVGGSDVSAANGFELLPGESLTMRAASEADAIHAADIYLFYATTQTAGFVVRSK